MEIVWQRVSGCRAATKGGTPDDRTRCDGVVARWADGDLQSEAALDQKAVNMLTKLVFLWCFRAYCICGLWSWCWRTSRKSTNQVTVVRCR